MNGKLVFLGTGSSTGVPLVGCKCSVCTSKDPHNQRLRSSVLLKIEGKTILIDASPDFRIQALQNGLTQLDGVILSHTHYDHVGGLDELRIFYIRNQQNLPVLLSQESLDEIKVRFYYFFKKKSLETTLSAQFDFHVLESKKGKTEFLGFPLSYMTYWQGGMEVTGFRFGDLAYLTDVFSYDDTLFDDLKGLKTLIISAVGIKASPVHFTIQEAIEFSKKVGAEKTWLIHMCHQVEHEKINEELPENIRLAYDGLTLQFEL